MAYRRPRVAVVSLHTSPLDQPGTGDAGGMNVYVRSAAVRLAACGMDVDVFTRRRSPDVAEICELAPGAEVVHVSAGPREPVPKADLPRYLPEFLEGVRRRARLVGGYDLVHTHYWLSGEVGRSACAEWGTPLVASFHTLAKVKNGSLAPGERPEPSGRLRGETETIARADRVVAATPSEAAQLVGLYGAEPDRVRLVPPGVDHGLFSPRPRRQVAERLHMADVRLLLFVGRLQAHKGPDVAIRTLAEVLARDPVGARDVLLAIVGGPSGNDSGGEVARIMDLAGALGVQERVVLFPPQPQARLADFYAAAEVVLVPSRSESFGLVALEAQACGTPVVGARVGGLRYVVMDGVTGFLVEGHDASDHAERVLQLLADRGLAERMGRAGVEHSMRFSWDVTARELRGVYEELLGGGA
jgi:D-inositol-3-phosphate glycosyltransferase